MKLDESTIAAIEAALDRKWRVEIIATKDGIKIYSLVRKELNNKT